VQIRVDATKAQHVAVSGGAPADVVRDVDDETQCPDAQHEIHRVLEVKVLQRQVVLANVEVPETNLIITLKICFEYQAFNIFIQIYTKLT